MTPELQKQFNDKFNFQPTMDKGCIGYFRYSDVMDFIESAIKQAEDRGIDKAAKFIGDSPIHKDESIEQILNLIVDIRSLKSQSKEVSK